jgi:Uri superfamily endonuclease
LQGNILKGSYVLLIELEQDSNIKVGALGKIHFSKGHYVYVGSAMNGIEGRVRRHLRDEKKTRWHVDYFLEIRM